MSEPLSFNEYTELASRTASKMTREGSHDLVLETIAKLRDRLNGLEGNPETLALFEQLLRSYSRNQHHPSHGDDARPMTPFEQELVFAGLGAAGEAGEIGDYIKKVFAHGHPLDPEKLKKEVGDNLWYLARVCKLGGFTFEEAAAANIEKLKARYPEGFSTERSLNRKD